MWYVQTMGFYSALKKNETMKFARKQIGPENTKLGEVTQTQREKRHLLSLFYEDPNFEFLYFYCQACV